MVVAMMMIMMLMVSVRLGIKIIVLMVPVLRELRAVQVSVLGASGLRRWAPRRHRGWQPRQAP